MKMPAAMSMNCSSQGIFARSTKDREICHRFTNARVCVSHVYTMHRCLFQREGRHKYGHSMEVYWACKRSFLRQDLVTGASFGSRRVIMKQKSIFYRTSFLLIPKRHAISALK